MRTCKVLCKKPLQIWLFFYLLIFRFWKLCYSQLSDNCCGVDREIRSIASFHSFGELKTSSEGL